MLQTHSVTSSVSHNVTAIHCDKLCHKAVSLDTFLKLCVEGSANERQVAAVTAPPKTCIMCMCQSSGGRQVDSHMYVKVQVADR